MAYAALNSLKLTINGLLNSSRISLVSSTQEILEYAYNETTSLQKVLERSNDSSRSSSRLNGLDGQIRDCAHELEDALEFHELNQLYSFEEVRQEITSFAERVEKMERDYIQELSSPVTKDDDDDDGDGDAAVSSNIDFGVEMVGYSSEFTNLRDKLLSKMRPDDLYFYSLVGEAGSGRTMVAAIVFNDLWKGDGGRQYCFDCGAWVTIGPEYELKEVVIRILAQVVQRKDSDYELHISRDEDEEICDYLYKILENRRYMIVLDDVCDKQVLHYLRRRSFPDQSNGSLVLLTTNLKEVAESTDCLNVFQGYPSEVTWPSIRMHLFGSESISAELEEAGNKIIENTRGLRIALSKTLLFLLKSEKTPEQWKKIAADKDNPVFMAVDEISEISKITTELQSYNWDTVVNQGEISAIRLILRWVEFSELAAPFRRLMHPGMFFPKMQTTSLFGMAGIGKTAFTRKIFHDRSILCQFDHRVWISLGQNYQTEEILIDVLAQIYPSIDKTQMKADEKLQRDLCLQLSCKRCLVVLDDLWNKEPLDRLKVLFPGIKGRALVTTRLAKVVKLGIGDSFYQMRLLSKEESWRLLREKVFVEGLCPPELEKAGRKIAENCEGLPLLILTVADQLLKVGKAPEYWNNVASGKQNSVFMDAHDEISKTLLRSYKSLPQHLKACFLYMGVFQQGYEIPTSKLINLWIIEGFLEPNPLPSKKGFVPDQCLSELVDNSLVMVQRKSIFQSKTHRLHSVFWHLSNSEAVKNKFFHAMNTYADCSVESMQSQRRLCIRNSILLGLKDVHDLVASLTTTHSLLCVNPPHQYQVSINFDLRLLRVMDALTIRLYEFPVEVVKRFHLRYLSLTCNGNLPTSISKLWKLQHLIVSRYTNTKSSEDSSLLPVEIWDMKELKHVRITGGCLPNPKCGDSLPKLLTLLDVTAQSCTEEVLKAIPNLRKLGIRIELAPDDEGNNPFRCLNNISHLRRLKSLKCVVVNPRMRPEVVAPPAPISMFPSSLTKLSLSGFGYPWEYMSIIGELQNLQVLKLKSYAFQGPKWEIHSHREFRKLKFLSIEDSDLVHLVNEMPIMQLKHLSIKHCYKLQKLPIWLPMLLTKIEIVDCNPLIVTQSEQMRQIRRDCKVEAHLSWIADSHEE